MDFPRSATLSEDFRQVAETGSTNQDLLSQAKELPDFSVLVADFQSSGRGRLDRSWEAAPGSSLMASVLLKPSFADLSGNGWLSLLMALAIKEVTQKLLPSSVVKVKWPNDVLVEGKKVSGILAEATPSLEHVVVGFGINLNQTQEELPVSSATSLALSGLAQIDKDAYLFDILSTFRSFYLDLATAGGDAEKAGLREKVQSASGTIGQEVEISYPDGTSQVGLAVGIDQTGRLLVQVSESEIAVSAADILHLRSH